MNEQWQWGRIKNDAFLQLKHICVSTPVLYSPDWIKKFILETDASGYALGAVIAQQFDNGIHPIGFYSQSLLPTECNYNAHDKELATIIFGFKMGCPFFLGASELVKVHTDHKNL